MIRAVVLALIVAGCVAKNKNCDAHIDAAQYGANDYANCLIRGLPRGKGNVVGSTASND